jgi:hypothetical protein
MHFDAEDVDTHQARDPDCGSDDDFDNPHHDWLDFG